MHLRLFIRKWKKWYFNYSSKRIHGNKEKSVPFSVTHHHKLKILSKIINYNLYLLYMYDRFEFPSSCKVSSYNWGRKLYPLDRKVGSYKCGKSVLKYMYNLMPEADASPCSVIEESFKAKHKLYFNKNVWYLSSHISDSRSSISVKL